MTRALSKSPVRGVRTAAALAAALMLVVVAGFFGRGQALAVGGTAPSWVDSSFGLMQVGVPYVDGVSATGDPVEMEYEVSNGALPAGLALNLTTGAVTGQPTVAGGYAFEITVSNGVDSDLTRPFSGTVAVANRGCQSYTGASYIGSVVLNPDGTPIGCGLTPDKGAPADLIPSNWAATFAGSFGPTKTVPYTERLGWACDDCWVGADGVDEHGGGHVGLPIGFPIDFYGTEYSTVFVESNGSISFGSGSDDYNDPLDVVLDGAAGVVAYGIDLYDEDIMSSGSTWGSTRHGDFFYWGRTTYNGHEAFVATWMNVGSCCNNPGSGAYGDFNTFQIMLVNVDDNAGTDVDIIVNYGSLTTTVQGYRNSGDPTRRAAVGVGSVQDGNIQYASMVDDNGVLYNGMPTADVADAGSHPLDVAHLNSVVPGRFLFQMRGGHLPQTATAPGAPTLTGTVRGNGVGTVAWTAPTDLGGSPISGYTVRWRIAGSSGAWTTHDTAATPYLVTGLTNGLTYEVQVAAVNGTGTGDFSNLGTVTPGVTGSPDWTDPTLGLMRVGALFADGVAASGEPAPTYAVTAGELPAGLSLDPATGAVTGTPTTAGPYDFTVTAGNDAGSALLHLTGTVRAALVAQAIAFAALPDVTLPHAALTIGATAASGLGVGFASNSPSICTVSGVTVTLVAAGTCSITASQAGDLDWSAAAPVTRTFLVAAAVVAPTPVATPVATPAATATPAGAVPTPPTTSTGAAGSGGGSPSPFLPGLMSLISGALFLAILWRRRLAS
jgi:hypothetical protein